MCTTDITSIERLLGTCCRQFILDYIRLQLSYLFTPFTKNRVNLVHNSQSIFLFLRKVVSKSFQDYFHLLKICHSTLCNKKEKRLTDRNTKNYHLPPHHPIHILLIRHWNLQSTISTTITTTLPLLLLQHNQPYNILFNIHRLHSMSITLHTLSIPIH